MTSIGKAILWTAGLLLLTAACSAPRGPERAPGHQAMPAPYRPAVLTGYLANKALTEASGLAASRRNAGLLWALNDSGNGPYLYAVGTDGTDYGRMRLRDAENVDWEDLAAFRFKGRHYLLVADFGDNAARRNHCVFYVVPEPALPENGFGADAAVRWARRIVFRYADGPRDCESVAVDPRQGKIYWLTKRIDPPQLYALPLVPDSGENPVAQKIADLVRLGEAAAGMPTSLLAGGGPYSHQPTAMDFSADRRLALVLTYGAAFLFERRGSETWPAALARSPQVIRLPPLRQAEAAGFTFPPPAVVVTSERTPAPLYRIEPGEPGP